jgi:hypothetical protein
MVLIQADGADIGSWMGHSITEGCHDYLLRIEDIVNRFEVNILNM